MSGQYHYVFVGHGRRAHIPDGDPAIQDTVRTLCGLRAAAHVFSHRVVVWDQATAQDVCWRCLDSAACRESPGSWLFERLRTIDAHRAGSAEAAGEAGRE